MNEPHEIRTLHEYVRVLRNRRLLIILTSALAATAALLYSALKEPSYEATATIEFKNEAQDLQLIGLPSTAVNQPEKQAAANARLVARDDVLERAGDAAGSNLTLEELRAQVTAEVQPDSNLIAIVASADNAELAASLANETARQAKQVARETSRAEYGRAVLELRKRLAAAPPGSATQATLDRNLSTLLTLESVSDPVRLTRSAGVPASPSSPKPVRDTLLAAILGLMLGVGIAFVRHALDRRLSDSHEVEAELGIPIVGYVRADVLGMVGAAANGRSRISEDDLEPFRILRTNVDFLAKDDLSSIVVTSPLPEEGKTTVASWYAYANAMAGRRTLLIECDFRRPTVSERFGLSSSPGLSDYLAGDAGPKEVLQAVAVEGPQAVETLAVITAGPNAFQPAEMITSTQFRAFLDQVTRAYDLVVIDSAPLLPVGDTLELVPQVDGVMLCLRLAQTTREQARAAKGVVDHLPKRPTGLVITGIQAGSDDDYYGYYSYSGEQREHAPTR